MFIHVHNYYHNLNEYHLILAFNTFGFKILDSFLWFSISSVSRNKAWVPFLLQIKLRDGGVIDLDQPG